jgi:hypothetical protein
MPRRYLLLFLPVGMLVAIVVSVAPSGCLHGDRAFMADPRLPDAVQHISLAAQQKGTGLGEVHDGIRATYGEPPRRDGGVEQWDINGGILTYSPVAGLFFVSGQGEMIRVVRHQNPLEQSLPGRYEMAAPPDARRGLAAYYLGNLEVKTDGTYLYTHAQFRDPRPDQANNFFMLHPSGEYRLAYQNGYGPQTLLESIPGNPRVAKLTFRAVDGAERTFFVARRPDADWKWLVFESDEGIEFDMHINWGGEWH